MLGRVANENCSLILSLTISPKPPSSTFLVKNINSLSGEIIGKYSGKAELTFGTINGSKGTLFLSNACSSS